MMRVSVVVGGLVSLEHPSSMTWVLRVDVLLMVGYTLTSDSMLSFQRAVFPLLLGAFLIIAGYFTSPGLVIRIFTRRNTGFPCLLRLIIWVMFKVFPNGSPTKETLAFLLDHPRRCFTLLFPSSATWWLFGVLVILNVIDLFFFLVLDLGDNYVSQIPLGYRFLDGFFQVSSSTLYPSPSAWNTNSDTFHGDINCRR